MKQLLETISRFIVSTPDGWCSEHKSFTLATLATALRPSLCVEIGVWSGRSLIPVAMALSRNNYGKIVGIDPWDAKVSGEGMEGVNFKWWTTVDHERIYREFMQRLKDWGVEEQCQILRSRSDDVNLIGHPPIGILHCDGNHSAQAERDVSRFAPLVQMGGFVVLDDLNWEGGAVSQSAVKLSSMGFNEIYKCVNTTTGDNWAYYQKVR